MSLLLEALKKAELAKQGHKPADDDETPAGAIQFEPAPPMPASAAQPRAQPFITRGELPDISQPLEILSEDLRGRDTGYPAPPAQTPACSFSAPGSSVVLASAMQGVTFMPSLSDG